MLKNITQIIVLTIAFSVLPPSQLQSQQNVICSNSYLAEKIYLQLDSKIYTTDKTIWFKSIVAIASDHAPTNLSGVLYVELIGPDEKIMEKKLIKLESGIGYGFFDMNQSYPEGVYLIRAYTEWDKNFGSDFFYKEYIQIFAPSAKSKPEPISNIKLEENRLDLQFFPESGELVHGLPSKVGFKALDYNGKGESVVGEIVNTDGDVVSLFESNFLGMGSFTLDRVDKNTAYFARLSPQSEEGSSNIYPLPAVAAKGNKLSVAENSDKIHLTASSNYLKNDSIYLRISCRGLVYYDIRGCLKDGVFAYDLPVNVLPEGIVAFTLMDSPMHPVAERLYFNERPESRIKIAVSTDNDTCTQRGLTRLNIETTNSNDEPLNSSISVLVLNKEQMGQIQNMRQNILSYFLLSSDLKGEIESPGFYFRKDHNNHDDLDALLLTQGWRKYLYAKPVDTILIQPEIKLTVSGSVSGKFFQKKKQVVQLTMMTFGKHKTVQKQMTDSLGRFNFNVNDEYGQNLNILIQSATRAGINKDYTIVLDKKESPVISFNHIFSLGKVDSVVRNLVEKNIERKKVNETYQLSSGDIRLGEVVVEAYRMTPLRKKVLEEYGKPDLVISGKTLQKEEEKWSYGLYSVLLARFPDKVTITRYYNVLIAQVRKSQPTLIVIDGVPVHYEDYVLIPSIPTSEVSSFEIIENAKNFSKLYKEFWPEADPLNVRSEGDVIAIYTYGGKGILGAERTVGIVQTAVPVYSVPREFYTPNYKDIQSADWYKPDLRALIHWEPMLQADSLGKVSTTFYNADIVGEMQVVIEAISENGEIGYQEISYYVKKRN